MAQLGARSGCVVTAIFCVSAMHLFLVVSNEGASKKTSRVWVPHVSPCAEKGRTKAPKKRKVRVAWRGGLGGEAASNSRTALKKIRP
jgi:hypothetical protein